MHIALARQEFNKAGAQQKTFVCAPVFCMHAILLACMQANGIVATSNSCAHIQTASQAHNAAAGGLCPSRTSHDKPGF